MPEIELTDQQRQYIGGLRALADVLEAEPELIPTYGIDVKRYLVDKTLGPQQVAAELVRFGALLEALGVEVTISADHGYASVISAVNSPIAPHAVGAAANLDLLRLPGTLPAPFCDVEAAS